MENQIVDPKLLEIDKTLKERIKTCYLYSKIITKEALNKGEIQLSSVAKGGPCIFRLKDSDVKVSDKAVFEIQMPAEYFVGNNDYLLGSLCHELSHFKWTEETFFTKGWLLAEDVERIKNDPAFHEEFKSFASTVYQMRCINDDAFQEYCRCVFNLIEDARIEHHFIKSYSNGFNVLNRSYQDIDSKYLKRLSSADSFRKTTVVLCLWLLQAFNHYQFKISLKKLTSVLAQNELKAYEESVKVLSASMDKLTGNDSYFWVKILTLKVIEVLIKTFCSSKDKRSSQNNQHDQQGDEKNSPENQALNDRKKGKSSELIKNALEFLTTHRKGISLLESPFDPKISSEDKQLVALCKDAADKASKEHTHDVHALKFKVLLSAIDDEAFAKNLKGLFLDKDDAEHPLVTNELNEEAKKAFLQCQLPREASEILHYLYDKEVSKYTRYSTGLRLCNRGVIEIASRSPFPKPFIRGYEENESAHIVFLFDRSGSVNSLDDKYYQSFAMLGKIFENTENIKTTFACFSSEVFLVKSVDENISPAMYSKICKSDGSTFGYEAIEFAYHELHKYSVSHKISKKIIVVISDGAFNHNDNKEKLKKLLSDEGICSIGLFVGGSNVALEQPDFRPADEPVLDHWYSVPSIEHLPHQLIEALKVTIFN